MQNTTHHNAFSDLQEASDTVHIKQELEKYWWHWRWFFAAVFIALLGAFFFFKIQHTTLQCHYQHPYQRQPEVGNF